MGSDLLGTFGSVRIEIMLLSIPLHTLLFWAHPGPTDMIRTVHLVECERNYRSANKQFDQRSVDL